MGAYKERKIRQNKAKRNIEIAGLTLSGVSGLLFVLVCLPLGKFSGFFLGVFGVGIYPLCILGALFGIGVYLSQRYYLQKRYFLYLVLNFLFLICLLHVAVASKGLSSASITGYGKYLSSCYNRSPLSVGGVLIGVVCYPLVCLMGVVGTCIVFAILLCIFVGLAVDFMFFKKNKLSKKDRERNIRTIYDGSEKSVDISSLTHDYDTRATKLVPKKFEKEDNERYLGLQTRPEGAEYFSNKLQGLNRADETPVSQYVAPVQPSEVQETQPVQEEAVKEQDVLPVESTQEDLRMHAKNLLFGSRENVTSERNAFNAAKDEEVYPSRYDPSVFSSKREYITTPILPDFLNRKEISRQQVLERNRQYMQEKQESAKISQSREEIGLSSVRDTSFLTQTEEAAEPVVSAPVAPVQPQEVEPTVVSTQNVAPAVEQPKNSGYQFDIRNVRQAVSAQENSIEQPQRAVPSPVTSSTNNTYRAPQPTQEIDRQPARDNINLSIEKEDEIDNFLPKQTFTPNTFVDPLTRVQDGSIPMVDMPTRPVRGVRGPDLAPRKTPDRSHVAPVRSDLVEEESVSETEQRRLGQNASVVAPSPSFLERNVSRPAVQESLLGNSNVSFNKETRPVDTKYTAPNANLLTTVSDDPSKYGGDTEEKSRILEETLESFRIGAKVSNVIKGPSVTRYELQIPAGIPVRKIANYESNIAMTLMSKNGIRLELPIPGKNAVGVEIPNDSPCTVGLRDMVMSREFQSASGALPVAIGKNISGEYVVRSMAKMVHLLVAGSTGSGKSVFLHNLILSLMFKSSPDQLRFIMIDPKRVEFIVYNGMPHMMLPNVVTECDKAINALSWATKEMDRRYRMFNQHLVNDIETFNKCPEVQSGEEPKIPYIVIVIDELADLMMVGQKEVERHIQRIAQLGRACGIHLVIATQRPTVQVVTGTIKANLPTRVAFSLTSVIDSKTILDEGGAEKLIGKGDMLFSPQGAPQPIRLQAAFASLEEVKAIVNFLKENNTTYYDEEVEKEIMAEPEPAADAADPTGGADAVDEFFYPALRLFIETGTASTTMIQRRFGVGYARAARLVDQMEVKGFISPQNGSKKRNVYITMDQYRELSGDED